MSRIANLAATNALISRLMQTQSRVNELQIQSATEKVSQNYKGIARDSQRLVNVENSRDMLSSFAANNESADLRLKTMESVLSGVQQTITDFREAMFEFESGSLDNEQRVKDIQDAAFRALSDLNVYLNSDVDGRFMFSGGRVTTQPVDFGLSTLTAFQTQYDGEATIYPPTRAAHVETNLDLSAAATGGLTMSGGNTITAATAGSLSGIPLGATITLADSANGNDGTYTVVSNDGTALTISGAMTLGASTITIANSTVNNGADATATLSVSGYYRGDTATQTQRVDQDREFTLDLNAIDPAFEKAIRAMGIIAQGVFGTNGGLDNHPERVDQALYLITASLDITTTGTAPFGAEVVGNLSQVQQDLGYRRVLIEQTNQQHETLIGYFDQNVIDTENVNTTEIIAKLLDETRALETAYQAIARIQQLSLAKFLG
jgi:flagellin-like hook-associated protein FlgL